MRYYAPLQDQVTTIPNAEQWLVPLYETPTVSENTSLVPNTKFQFVWDSVSLNSIKTCPRKYNWEILHGYHLDPMPSTLMFGIQFHSCMEVWHKLRAQQIDADTALQRCTRLAGLFGEYLTGERTERTKQTLVRAVVWYLDQFRDDPAQITTNGDGSPAAELSFSLPLKKINGIQVHLAGHIDKVVKFLGKIFIADYKTTKSQLNERFFSQFKPNGQVQGYLTAGLTMAGSIPAIPEKPSGILIDGIQLGVNFTRYHRSIIEYSTLEINTFLSDLEQWLQVAALYAEAEHWPANEQACGNYGGCVFRSICSQTPAKHERLLKSNFKKSLWDPRKER